MDNLGGPQSRFQTENRTQIFISTCCSLTRIYPGSQRIHGLLNGTCPAIYRWICDLRLGRFILVEQHLKTLPGDLPQDTKFMLALFSAECISLLWLFELAMFFFLLQLSAVVDGVYSEHSHTAGTFSMLSSSRVYVGGSQNTHALPGSRIHNNFVGCLRKVV
jgi:hypothetical protein